MWKSRCPHSISVYTELGHCDISKASHVQIQTTVVSLKLLLGSRVLATLALKTMILRDNLPTTLSILVSSCPAMGDCPATTLGPISPPTLPSSLQPTNQPVNHSFREHLRLFHGGRALDVQRRCQESAEFPGPTQPPSFLLNFHTMVPVSLLRKHLGHSWAHLVSFSSTLTLQRTPSPRLGFQLAHGRFGGFSAPTIMRANSSFNLQIFSPCICFSGEP